YMTNEFQQHGYWAIILGGSSGLGLASAKKLARHGMNICIIHRNSRSEMKAVSQYFEDIKALGVRFLALNMDAVNPQKMQEALVKIKAETGNKKIRCLLHSIAKGNLKPMEDEEEATLRKDDFMITFENMTVSLYQWTKMLLQHDLFAEDSRVLSFTSEGNQKAIKHY